MITYVLISECKISWRNLMVIYIVKNAEYNNEVVGRIDWSNFVKEGYVNLSTVVANRCCICLF